MVNKGKRPAADSALERNILPFLVCRLFSNAGGRRVCSGWMVFGRSVLPLTLFFLFICQSRIAAATPTSYEFDQKLIDVYPALKASFDTPGA